MLVNIMKIVSPLTSTVSASDFAVYLPVIHSNWLRVVNFSTRVLSGHNVLFASGVY